MNMEFTQEYKKMVDKILNDELVVKKLHLAESADEIKAIFAESGLLLSDDDAIAAFNQMSLLSDEGELSEDALDGVAGGCLHYLLARLVGCTRKEAYDYARYKHSQKK